MNHESIPGPVAIAAQYLALPGISEREAGEPPQEAGALQPGRWLALAKAGVPPPRRPGGVFSRPSTRSEVAAIASARVGDRRCTGRPKIQPDRAPPESAQRARYSRWSRPQRA